MLSYFSRQKTAANKWEHSSAGRASALQAEGHRFEPYCSHHYGLVVQLVRTLACHARGRRFDPDPGRQFASVAQSVEQGTENPRVIGSIPIGGTINADVAHPVERHLAKVEVASPSLVYRSTCGCSSMVELQPSKLVTWVRFPSPAPAQRVLFMSSPQETVRRGGFFVLSALPAYLEASP